MDWIDAGHGTGRKSGESAGTPETQDDAQASAGERQQNALGEQLANDFGSAGTERDANGNLSPARHGTRPKQAGYVSAGDQQYQSNRSEQNQHRGPDVRHHQLLELVEANGEAWVGVQHGRILMCVL